MQKPSKRLKAVPSSNVIPSRPSAPVSSDETACGKIQRETMDGADNAHLASRKMVPTTAISNREIMASSFLDPVGRASMWHGSAKSRMLEITKLTNVLHGNGQRGTEAHTAQVESR